MISYCICVLRPRLFYVALEDLIRKTTVPYEILIWLNTRAPELEDYIGRMAQRGVPIKIVGTSHDNVGMLGYKVLFRSARYEMIVQMHDDVLCISKGIGEKASSIFKQHPKIKQIVADVIQDGFTTGGRPGIDAYTVMDEADGLLLGPVDGWFSIYHRSILPLLLEAPYATYFYLGSYINMQLRARSYDGVLCQKMKVFHIAGPAYAHLFDTVGTETRKFEKLGNTSMIELYTKFPITDALMDQMYSEYRKGIEQIESMGSK